MVIGGLVGNAMSKAAGRREGGGKKGGGAAGGGGGAALDGRPGGARAGGWVGWLGGAWGGRERWCLCCVCVGGDARSLLRKGSAASALSLPPA